jgi:hypothetical protein
VGDGLGIDPPRLEPGLEIAAYYNAAAAAIPEGFRVTASAVRASAEGDVYDIKLACEQADASPNTAVLVRFSRIERQLAADEISVGFDTSSLFTQDASGALVASCGPQIDPIYAEALDVHAEKIFIDPAAPAPTQYTPPPRITIGDAGGVSLNGTEFWRMWLEGQVEDIRNFSFSEGTELGRKCMQASAIRFEAVMAQAPAELADLLANSTWGGSFFNWNDDYSMGGQLESRAKLWAWRSHLIKWISQTAPDGTCYLPTLDMLEQLMPICIETAAANEGSVQGCDVQW